MQVLPTFGLVLAMIAYTAATLRWRHIWRPLGFEPLEYILGAALIVGTTNIAGYMGLLPSWQAYAGQLTWNYIVGGLPVIVGHVIHAGREQKAARQIAREAESGNTAD